MFVIPHATQRSGPGLDPGVDAGPSPVSPERAQLVPGSSVATLPPSGMTLSGNYITCLDRPHQGRQAVGEGVFGGDPRQASSGHGGRETGLAPHAGMQRV